MTQIMTRLTIAVLLLTVAACRNTAPAATQATSSAQTPSAHASAIGGGTPAAAEQPANPLASVLGLRGLPVPSELVPGGDCPPAGDRGAPEIAAQAAAPIPLKEGLTLAYSWMRTPREEYECLIHVQKIDADGIDTTASCNDQQPAKPTRKRVCRTDLRNAHLLHTMYGVVKVLDASGEEQPETIVGATAFSLSSSEYAELTRKGSFTHHYVELGSSGQLEKDGVGELHLDGRDTMTVVVNNQTLQVPVLKTSGTLTWWIRGQRLETSDSAVILDSEAFPLLIDQYSSAESTASRIRFSKITYPSEAGRPLEGQLLASKRVDVYGIYFDFNSDRIRPESEPVLQEIGQVMARHPDWRLSIEGHTDNIGGDTGYNLDLSRRRSEAVRTALVNRFGIAADRLAAAGHGASSPKDTNDTPEGRARNRRVELVRQ